MMRPAQLGRLAASAARSATSRRLHAAAAAVAAALPALASPTAGPCGVPVSPERPSAQLPSHSNGLTPHQAFAAHSLAAEGSAPTAGEVDEVVARLREHLEAMFSAAAPPAGMCASPGTAAAAAAPAPAPATTLRSSAQAVAARLTKPAAADVPLTLVVEANPPYRLSWANAAWEELAGLDWQEVGGQPCLEVVAGSLTGAEGAPAGLVDALAARARGSATVELLQDGVPLPVRVTASPLLERSGSSDRMLLVFAPIQTSVSA
ncbi:hypothetical protein ABPG75_001876 [Micractinium tetrahymenae]